jgi:hypothetical protein
MKPFFRSHLNYFLLPAVLVATLIFGHFSFTNPVVKAATIRPSSLWNVFVTSQSYTGNLGGLSGADYKCQTLAWAAGRPGEYKAWLSTSSVHAKNRIPEGRYVLFNMAAVAMSKTDLTDGTIQNAINRDEWGNLLQYAPYTVFTGTLANGTGSGQYCQNWQSSSPGSNGRAGFSSKTDKNWTSYTNNPCDVPFRLYCFQTGIFPVPTPPSP